MQNEIKYHDEIDMSKNFFLILNKKNEEGHTLPSIDIFATIHKILRCKRRQVNGANIEEKNTVYYAGSLVMLSI